MFRWTPFGVVELNNAADDGGGVAQGCHHADDDKEGGGCEHDNGLNCDMWIANCGL